MLNNMSQIIAFRVDKEEADDIQILAESNGYKDKSKFMRDIVRKEWDKWVRKQKKYFKEHPEDYVPLSTIKEDLNKRSG